MARLFRRSYGTRDKILTLSRTLFIYSWKLPITKYPNYILRYLLHMRRNQSILSSNYALIMSKENFIIVNLWNCIRYDLVPGIPKMLKLKRTKVLWTENSNHINQKINQKCYAIKLHKNSDLGIARSMQIKRVAELDRSHNAIDEQCNVAFYNDVGHPTETKKMREELPREYQPSRMKEKDIWWREQCRRMRWREASSRVISTRMRDND